MSISMGLPWIFESIHYTIHRNHETKEICQSALETFFRVLSILNCSRGIIMFFIFVCKRSVWRKVQRTEPFRTYLSTRNKRKNRESVLTMDVHFESVVTEEDVDVQHGKFQPEKNG